MLSAYHEIKSRGAEIYVFTNDIKFVHKNTFFIDTNSDLSEILYMIPFQIIAYEMALNKNLNPDYPRNLAKVVTVE